MRMESTGGYCAASPDIATHPLILARRLIGNRGRPSQGQVPRSGYCCEGQYGMLPHGYRKGRPTGWVVVSITKGETPRGGKECVGNAVTRRQAHWGFKLLCLRLASEHVYVCEGHVRSVFVKVDVIPRRMSSSSAIMPMVEVAGPSASSSTSIAMAPSSTYGVPTALDLARNPSSLHPAHLPVATGDRGGYMRGVKSGYSKTNGIVLVISVDGNLPCQLEDVGDAILQKIGTAERSRGNTTTNGIESLISPILQPLSDDDPSMVPKDQINVVKLPTLKRPYAKRPSHISSQPHARSRKWGVGAHRCQVLFSTTPTSIGSEANKLEMFRKAYAIFNWFTASQQAIPSMGSMNDVKLVTDLHLALASQLENKLYREEFKFRETKSLKVEINFHQWAQHGRQQGNISQRGCLPPCEELSKGKKVDGPGSGREKGRAESGSVQRNPLTANGDPKASRMRDHITEGGSGYISAEINLAWELGQVERLVGEWEGCNTGAESGAYKAERGETPIAERPGSERRHEPRRGMGTSV
ncbi:hypothetical protein BJV77DRAFT_965428 [Russula vinacea]|nr:hypothetical protein BJV77DRAFT_965428 [Russula vinacea]